MKNIRFSASRNVLLPRGYSQTHPVSWSHGIWPPCFVGPVRLCHTTWKQGQPHNPPEAESHISESIKKVIVLLTFLNSIPGLPGTADTQLCSKAEITLSTLLAAAAPADQEQGQSAREIETGAALSKSDQGWIRKTENSFV